MNNSRLYDSVGAARAPASTDKWRDCVAGGSAALARFDPAYRPLPGNLPLMRFLFPEIAAKVDAFWAKADMAPTVSA